MLDEEVREGTWWPKVATNSHYMRHGNVAGGGNLDGFLGLRRHKGVLQLRVEYNGMHGMNSAYQVVKIAWEGGAPPPEAARAFFIPVSRTDGTARYLVIAATGRRTLEGLQTFTRRNKRRRLRPALMGGRIAGFCRAGIARLVLYESKAGPVTATVEASSQIRLDDGSLGKGFIFRAGGGTIYVAITPADRFLLANWCSARTEHHCEGRHLHVRGHSPTGRHARASVNRGETERSAQTPPPKPTPSAR